MSPSDSATATGSTPLVSVAVPVYQHADFVRACLDSIVGQDYPRVELIVIDDGSTDASAAVVEEFLAEHGDRVERTDFRSRANKGLLATMDELVERSRGEIFLPVASDDMLLPGAIARRTQLLAERPDRLAVFTDCEVIDERGVLRAESGIRDIHGGNTKALCFEPALAFTLMLKWSIPGPCITLRRSAFDPTSAVGPYSELSFPEDLDLYVRLAANGAAWFVPETLARYRLHSDNISRTRPDLMLSGNLEAITRLAPELTGPDRLLARAILAATGSPGATRTATRAALALLRSVWLPVAGLLGRAGSRSRPGGRT